MTTGLNVLYALPLPHRLLKFTRKVDILIVLAGPVLFGWALNVAGDPGLDWEWVSARSYLAPYTVVACILGLIIAPLAQIAYWMRRTRERIIEERTEVVDVARALGAVPAGRGKYRRIAFLPGNEVFQVEFRCLRLHVPRLPEAWEGLSLLHLTDLHLCGTPDRGFYNFVVERCMAEGIPDILALTGDVVDSSWHHRWIVPILGKLRWNLGGYAILGNHDSWRDTQTIRRRLARVGFRVLGNGFHVLAKRPIAGGCRVGPEVEARQGLSSPAALARAASWTGPTEARHASDLLVVGHEGPWFGPPPDPSAWPSAAFTLCLSHTPDNIAWAKRHGVDLVLAGHVHGGQIRLPLVGSIFCPSRYSRRYDCGTFYEAPTLMHVSRGLAGQHPLRYNCRPEVTRIVLARSRDQRGGTEPAFETDRP